MRQRFKSFMKFPSFFNEVESVLSNLLMILAIIMLRYNSIQGKNKMIRFMFSFLDRKSEIIQRGL